MLIHLNHIYSYKYLLQRSDLIKTTDVFDLVIIQVKFHQLLQSFKAFNVQDQVLSQT